MNWAALIWTAVWIVAGVLVLGVIVWGVVMIFALRQFKKIERSIDRSIDRVMGIGIRHRGL